MFTRPLEGINIQLNKILRVFYCYIFDYSNVQAVNFCQISEPSYIKIKELIIKTVPNETKKIGGEGLEVQIDETAICNGLIIKNPSSTLDDKKNVQ
ncbi:hypothetical protein H311_00564 [Anncaliia algerae PRA109]|nr:hypothetical protein H311_00564 [Anncaliia algerae PRA109]